MYNWFRRLFREAPVRPSVRKKRSRIGVEVLEDRLTPSLSPSVLVSASENDLQRPIVAKNRNALGVIAWEE